MLVTGIFLGTNAFLQYPHEIGRWQMAAANEFWTEAEMAALRGEANRAAENRDKAFAKLAEAQEWSPDDVNRLLTRASWNSEVGKQEAALADCAQVIKQTGELSPLLLLRMDIYQQLGRHAEAVKDANQLDAISQTSGNPSRGDALNTVAYVKAVGRIDLPGALLQSDQSVRGAVQEIEQHKKDDDANSGFLARIFQAFFGVNHRMRDYAAKRSLCLKQDTRGFVHYQMGNFKESLSDLDSASDGITGLLNQRDSDVRVLHRALPDSRPLAIETARERRGAAVVFYHRALAHEKLGHTAAAAADRQRVRELIGRDGDEKLF